MKNTESFAWLGFIVLIFVVGCQSSPQVYDDFDVPDKSTANQRILSMEGEVAKDYHRANDTSSGTNSELGPDQKILDDKNAYHKSLQDFAIKNGMTVGEDRIFIEDPDNRTLVGEYVLQYMYGSPGQSPIVNLYQARFDPGRQVLMASLQGQQWSNHIPEDRLKETLDNLKKSNPIGPVRPYVTNASDLLRARLGDKDIPERWERPYLKFRKVTEEDWEELYENLDGYDIDEEHRVRLKSTIATILRINRESGRLVHGHEKTSKERTWFGTRSTGKGPVAIYGDLGFSLLYIEEINLDVSAAVGVLWNGSSLIPLANIKLTHEGENYYVYTAIPLQVGAGYKTMLNETTEFRIGAFANVFGAGIEASVSWVDDKQTITFEELLKRCGLPEYDPEKKQPYWKQVAEYDNPDNLVRKMLLHENEYYREQSFKILGKKLDLHDEVKMSMVNWMIQIRIRNEKNMINRQVSGAKASTETSEETSKENSEK